jgi:hypothetical protein
VRRIRILNLESAAHQRVNVIYLSTLKVLRAEGIHEYLDTFKAEHLIDGVRRIIQGHTVGESGTAARLDIDAQTKLIGMSPLSQGGEMF